jgi:hypothetical protein
MKKGKFAGQAERRVGLSRTDLFDMSDASLVEIAAKHASWDDVDLSDDTEQYGGRS